tara:strand:+ start:888 stop:1166 length:279 start_codon:yes stop_codon:yes gene_type:complete
MAIADDLGTFLGDMGVSATAGSTTATGILDQPTSVVLGDQVLFVDYQFHCKTSDFGALVGGDAITIDGTAYTVRSVEKDSDGLMSVLSVSKN